MNGESEGDKDAMDEGKKRWKMSESKIKVQTGTDRRGERTSYGGEMDGLLTAGVRNMEEKKAERCLAVKQRRV